MSYPRRLLTEGEDIIREFRPHWRLLFIPAGWTLLGIAVIAAAWLLSDIVILNWVLTGAALVVILWWGVRPFVHWWFTHYILTSERLIRRAGFIARSGVEIPLENINDVQFSQKIVERLLRSGDLLIESAGEMGQSRFEDIPQPEEFQSLIYRVREERANSLAQAGSPLDHVAQLEALTRLHREGVLSDEEYAEKRQNLLDRM